MISRNLVGNVFCAILLVVTSSTAAHEPNDPAAPGWLAGHAEDSPAAASETTAEPSPCAGGCDVGDWPSYFCPRWTASADFIILDRIGGGNQTLVSRVPHDEDPFANTGVEALNSSDFRQGFCGGPRLDLIRHGDSGYDLELSYFQISGWGDNRPIGPDDPIDWLVMRAPGGFTQTNQPPLLSTQAMDWDYASQLYSAELNVRWDPCCRVTMLAGFRWVNLGEKLVGALEPPTISWEPPFWNTTTRNNLFGLQIGADGKVFEHGRFSMDVLGKAGIFDNCAEETTAVSVIAKQVREGTASTTHAAFVGETGLQCKYQVSQRFC